MTLRDILERLDALGDELTIYARDYPELTEHSEAVVALEPEDGSLPAEGIGMARP